MKFFVYLVLISLFVDLVQTALSTDPSLQCIPSTLPQSDLNPKCHKPDSGDAPSSQYPWQNYNLDLDTRVDDLLSRLTLEEMINQTWSEAPAIPRMGIHSYNWRSNCLHGWSSSGGKWQELSWSVFPEPIGLGATFDPELVRLIAIATADEGRALHNIGRERNDGASLEAMGVNCFAPNVNLLRDPRWGRGQETFGEDPVLISALGLAYTKGLQEGDDPTYMKIAACGKHYAIHSGPEAIREKFVVEATLLDIFDTYLPAFEVVIKQGNTATLMPAYTGLKVLDGEVATNGAPDPANKYLLNDIARKKYGFTGVHISDNGAVIYVYDPHHYAKSKEEAAALCINATCDMDLGWDRIYPDYLGAAVSQSLVDPKLIQESARRLLRLRFQLGEFDPFWRVPYKWLGKEVLASPGHEALNIRAAKESLVLLKNENALLPLPKSSRVAIIGPNGNDTKVLLGNYQGIPNRVVTPLKAIQEKIGDSQVTFSRGCLNITCDTSELFAEAKSAADQADIIVMFLGISGSIEWEGHDRTYGYKCDGKGGSETLGLPGCQFPLLQEMVKLGKPIVLVLINGGPVSIPWEKENIPAILEAFYPGNLGGIAIADTLFGDYNPSGKLPFTLYPNEGVLPPLTDYRMSKDQGRTYKYYNGDILYPFGWGLSYTEFHYSNMKIINNQISPCELIDISVDVSNVGKVIGEEVVQIYVIVPTQQNFPTPKISLQAFKRISLFPGETATVNFTLDPMTMTAVDKLGDRYIFPGTYQIFAEGHLPNEHSQAMKFEVSGSQTHLSDC